MKNSLITTEQPVNRSLAVATARLNDAINNHVVRLAKANGSTTTPVARFVHFANTSAKAIGLPKSDTAVIAALPIEDRATLALIRQGVAARIPQWTAQVETEHRAKYHAALLEKADAQLIDKSTRLAKLESPGEYLSAFTTGIIDDFNRRTRGAIGATQRSDVVPSGEMVHQAETARALLDELLELWRDRRAHESAAALPALEVAP